MTPLRLITPVLATALIVGCAPVPAEEDLTPPPAPVEPETPPALEECDAADYRHLVGTNIAAVTLPSGERMRVYGESDIITQEYIPQRTNIVYDAEGLILRAYCG